MEVIIVVGVLAAALGLFFGGRLTASNGRASVTPVGTNDSGADCTGLCSQWDQRRQERCLAESAAQASQRKVDNFRAQWAIAMGIAAGFAVAAYLASLIPVYGWIAAAVLGAIAAAAFLAAMFIAGELSVADEELAAAERNAAAARTAEAEARSLLVTKCPGEAGACLSRPSPC